MASNANGVAKGINMKPINEESATIEVQQIYLPRATRRHLKTLAASSGATMSSMLDAWIEDAWAKSNEKKEHESYMAWKKQQGAR